MGYIQNGHQTIRLTRNWYRCVIWHMRGLVNKHLCSQQPNGAIKSHGINFPGSHMSCWAQNYLYSSPIPESSLFIEVFMISTCVFSHSDTKSVWISSDLCVFWSSDTSWGVNVSTGSPPLPTQGLYCQSDVFLGANDTQTPFSATQVYLVRSFGSHLCSWRQKGL